MFQAAHNPELFQTLFDQSPDFIQVFTFAGKCMYVNQTALDFFGYTKDWALGRHVSDFVPLYMKDTALWPSRVNELRTTKKFYTRRSQLDGHGQLHELEYFVNYAKVHDIEYAITIGNFIFNF